jgi:glycosyltransferase involved in cell wall biosynthesis
MTEVELHTRITVVIPAYNEEAYIGGLLNDISMQFHAEGMTVIIADGGSTDRTLEVIAEKQKEYKDYLDIQVVKGGTVTRGRNAGLKLVKTEDVLFIDADVRLTNPFQIFNVWYKLGSHKLVGAKLRSNSGFPSNIVYRLFNIVNSQLSKKHPFAVGSFFGTKVKTLKSLGRWNEKLIHGEDWVLSRKYAPSQFTLCSYPILADDRRFKKTGYWGMFKLMITSAWRGEEYMKQDHGYWK